MILHDVQPAELVTPPFWARRQFDAFDGLTLCQIEANQALESDLTGRQNRQKCQSVKWCLVAPLFRTWFFEVFDGFWHLTLLTVLTPCQAKRLASPRPAWHRSLQPAEPAPPEVGIPTSLSHQGRNSDFAPSFRFCPKNPSPGHHRPLPVFEHVSETNTCSKSPRQSCAGNRIAPRQSCAGNRIAPVNPALATGLPRQSCAGNRSLGEPRVYPSCDPGPVRRKI